MPGAATALITFAEFEQMPDVEGFRMELHDGEVIYVAPPKLGHRMIQRHIRFALEQDCGNRAVVETELGFRIPGKPEYRIPDVVLVSRERLKNPQPSGDLIGAPELVVEVLSPANRTSEMRAREKLCLENGCREFWVVDPVRHEVRVSTADGSTRKYKKGDEIPLPYGGCLSVELIFSPVFA